MGTRILRVSLRATPVAGAFCAGADPAAADDYAAFLPAGQNAAWFNAARFKLADALSWSARF